MLTAVLYQSLAASYEIWGISKNDSLEYQISFIDVYLTKPGFDRESQREALSNGCPQKQQQCFSIFKHQNIRGGT